MSSDRAVADFAPPVREWHGTHHEWSYAPQAFIWNGEWIAGVNFVSFATAMRRWMQQSGQLTVLLKKHRTEHCAASNPYSYSGSAITLLFSEAINECHDYATSNAAPDDPLTAEAMRLRLFNEVLLYSARFCEVVIKQLLYCTQVPQKLYESLALGQLLNSPCQRCKKKTGKVPHMVSWVGTLACPFRLCYEFDHCGMDHMAFLNTLRNARVAHSGSEDINPRTARESKDQLQHDATQVLNGVVHLLTHIEKLEEKMYEDLAIKGAQINSLKRRGLSPDECNFNLEPGLPFKHPGLEA